jgi:hypothetical protein
MRVNLPAPPPKMISSICAESRPANALAKSFDQNGWIFTFAAARMVLMFSAFGMMMKLAYVQNYIVTVGILVITYSDWELVIM